MTYKNKKYRASFTLFLLKKSVAVCKKGAVAIEFALIFPIYLLITFVSIEFGLIAYNSFSIEHSLSTTMRDVKVELQTNRNTANFSDGRSFTDFIRQEVQRRAPALINEDRLLVTSDLSTSAVNDFTSEPETCLDSGNGITYECLANGSANACNPGDVLNDGNGNGLCDNQPNQPILGLGAPGDVSIIKAVYNWKLLTPFTCTFFGNDNCDYQISSTILFRNEFE